MAHSEHTHSPITAARRHQLHRNITRVALLVVAYNLIEAVVAIWAGAAAGSISLLGFGLDSLIEMSSALVILWQFRRPLPEQRERAALRAIAIAFFALATYLTVESMIALVTGERPDTSVPGIVITAVSLVVMPVLSRRQRGFGRELGSHAVVADSQQTLLCTYMSAAVLLGLIVQALTGWVWVDPVVSFGIAALALKEGRDAWRGDACTCVTRPAESAQSSCGGPDAC